MAEKPKVIVAPIQSLGQVNQKHFKKGGGVGKANAKPKMMIKKMGKR
jgi:hypothetical protein|tara:strand:+ start:233 stop:373 length:141 start_codon:yes stop_codon:yes gene_type:complete